MLELSLRSARKIARARRCPTGSYLDGLAAALREIGYCRLVGESCITYAVHYSLWAAGENVGTAGLDEDAVHAFLAHLPKCCCPGQRAWP